VQEYYIVIRFFLIFCLFSALSACTTKLTEGQVSASPSCVSVLPTSGGGTIIGYNKGHRESWIIPKVRINNTCSQPIKIDRILLRQANGETNSVGVVPVSLFTAAGQHYPQSFSESKGVDCDPSSSSNVFGRTKLPCNGFLLSPGDFADFTLPADHRYMISGEFDLKESSSQGSIFHKELYLSSKPSAAEKSQVKPAP
jgi:hypothetical protein